MVVAIIVVIIVFAIVFVVVVARVKKLSITTRKNAIYDNIRKLIVAVIVVVIRVCENVLMDFDALVLRSPIRSRH